jgi:predicted permease
MDTLLAIFVRVIVPVMITVGVGYLAGRLLVFDLKMLARLGLYVLVPCLTFTAMARTTLAAGEFGRIVAFTLISVPLLWGISGIAARLLKLIGDSLVPFLLLVMGMQLAAVDLRGSWKAASVATVLRLVVAAGLSFGLARGLGLTGLTRQTMILENSMPSAILGVALAQEFDTAPELITKIIFLTTLAGLFTLTVLLALF